MSRQIEPIWGSGTIVKYKYIVGSASIPELILYVVMAVMWGFGLIKSFPARLIDYGFIYSIPHTTSWIVSLGAASSKSPELFLFAFFIRLFVLIVDCIAFSFATANVINCWINVLPITCRDTEFADIVIAFMLLIFVILSFIIFFCIATVLYNVTKGERRMAQQEKQETAETIDSDTKKTDLSSKLVINTRFKQQQQQPPRKYQTSNKMKKY